MHITITGNLGSGKSTICTYLNKTYGFTVYSTGKIQRELSRELNLSTLDMNKLMAKDTHYDHCIDDATARIAKEQSHEDLIFDSRLAWNFVPKSFKVFLIVDINIAAERVMNDQRGKEECYTSFEEAKKKLKERAESENQRYQTIYNLDYMNLNNYDLVIDASFCKPEIMAELIYSKAKEYFQGSDSSYRPSVLLSWKNIYPIKRVLSEGASDGGTCAIGTSNGGTFNLDFSESDCNEIAISDKKHRLYPVQRLPVIKYKDFYFMIGDHKLAVSCARHNIPFVSVSVMNPKNDCAEIVEVLCTSTSRKDLNSYESACDFTYLSVPNFIKN